MTLAPEAVDKDWGVCAHCARPASVLVTRYGQPRAWAVCTLHTHVDGTAHITGNRIDGGDQAVST